MVEQGYLEEQYSLALLDFRIARNEEQRWEARKTLARLEQIAANFFGFGYVDELRGKVEMICMK